MTIQRSLGLIAMALAAGPAAAQQVARPREAPRASLFPQAFQPNPFNALLSGKFSIGGSLGTEVSNNVLDVGDAVSILLIACNPPQGKVLTPDFACDKPGDNMRPSDLLLIAGVLPDGQDAQVRLNVASEFQMAVPTRWGNFGITSAGRAIGRMAIPSNMTALLRNGFTGDTLTLDLGGLSGKAIGYADIAMTWLGRLPFTGAGKSSSSRFRGGVGVHWLRPIAYPTVSFLDTNAARTPSRITVSVKDSVSGNITMVTPVDPLLQSGKGWGLDFYTVADLGRKWQVSALLSNVGSMTVTHGDREMRRMTASRLDIETFQNRLDSMTVDTIAGMTEKLGLPRALRLETSYRPYKRLGLGLAVDKALEHEWSTDDLRTTAVVELGFPTWIPLRFGMTSGTGKAPSAFAGIGLRTSHFISEWEVVARGFPLDKTQGIAFRTGGAFVF